MKPTQSELKELRKRIGEGRRLASISDAELGRIAKVHPSQIGRICRGDFKTISNSVVQICTALNIDGNASARQPGTPANLAIPDRRSEGTRIAGLARRPKGALATETSAGSFVRTSFATSGAFRHEGLTELILAQWKGEKPQIKSSSFFIASVLTRLSILANQFPFRVGQEYDLSQPEVRLLYSLRRGGPPFAQRPTDLFRLLGVTSGAITYTLTHLKKRELVEAIVDEGDRRSVIIRLTVKGLAVVNSAVAETAATLRAVTREIPETELATIERGLLRLVKAYEAFVDRHAGAAPGGSGEL